LEKIPAWGTMLSLLIFFFPPLYGEGYNTINILLASGDLFNHSLMKVSFTNLKQMDYCGFSDTVILFKVFATSATNVGAVPEGYSLPPCS
jgi:CIC family chloride channel protein